MSSVDGDHSIISRLDKNLVHKICSGQVVVTLASAVKELLENSIDAKSTKIEIRLRGHGSESIEVIDNGVGIGEEDFESLTGKYCTSKLNTFDDLSCVETYGFRGEALSSLCHLAKVTIHTCAFDAKIGTKLEFDSSGRITNRRSLARSQGTTVCVNQLFYDLPVRRRHLTDPNRLSKEFAKVISLLTAYCLVCVGVQISCSRVGKKGELINVISNGPSISLKDNIAAVFGHTQLDSLIELEEIVSIPEDICEEFNLKPSSVEHPIKIFGYVSKPPDPSTSISSSLIDSSPSPSSTSKRRTCIGYSSSERQFIYINGRPCDLPKVTRLATDLWRRCSKEAYSSMASGISLPNRSTFNSFPVLIFIFTMPTQSVDINLTPDKRTLLLHHENYVLALTKAVLVKTLFNSNGMEINSFSQSRIDFDQSQIVTDYRLNDTSQMTCVSMPIHNKRQSILSDISVSPKRGHYSCDQLSSSSLEIIDLSPDASIHQQSKVEETPLEHLQSFNLKGEDHLKDYPDYENIENRLLSSDINLESIKVEFSMESLRNNWKQILQMTPSGSAEISLSNNNLHNNTHINDDNPTEGSFTFSKFKSIENQEAENELTTYFEKETFNSLQVIGQFNLGFIIARHNQDLFIVDQHASDEKYRFEQLSENYRFKSQPLVVPKKLNLTVANEQVLINNLDVFAKNGFAFRIHNDEPPGQQVFLVAAPMLENKLFSYRDIEEMLFVLSETCNKRCRPSRLRDILASRSCRSAVMVGTALDQKKMKRILTNMGSMDHPWNCPHGRPTMRHLFHLDLVNDN
ncbi:Mismatch repair endonuclease PMS2 [Schistosoma japonicum]|nr:Mismatch repair endonuclease PMS2 [Schistosoma japonicum]KAH8857916.1 Mismatch repair endonuclease PMS2 [Schistosoma japonicum]KAH8857917.1 Mismatch repair endonuclease PMS2 [Schistosoma japonicum]KAH8857918.1 Mismatch repair endonuclease PMS2 [Schistosoma japonicum]